MKVDIVKKYIPSNYYITWWTAVFATFLLYDVLFCVSVASFQSFTFKALYTTLFACATIFSLPAAITRKWGWQVVILLLLDLLLLSNLLYSRTYFMHIPIDGYMMVGNLKDFTSSVWDSLRWYDLSFLVIPLVAIAVSCRNTPPHKCKRVSTINSISYIVLLAVTLLASYFTVSMRGGFMKRMAYIESEVALIHTMSPVYSVFSCIAYDLLTRDSSLTDVGKSDINKWLNAHSRLTRDYAEFCISRDSVKIKQNLVVILCESLESWPIGLSLESKEITPFMNRLIEDSTTYYNPQVLTQVGDGRSIDGQLLILTGMHPLKSGVYSARFAQNRYYTIAKAMKEKGARTIIVTPDEPSTWNQAGVALGFGMDTLITINDFDLTRSGAMMEYDHWLTDDALFRQTVEKMSNGNLWDENEYALIVILTHTGHNPFYVSDEYDALKLQGTYPKVLKDYLTAAHYTDNSMKQFVDYLKSRSDWSHTTVVITGDHEGLASYRDDLSSNYEYVSPERMTPLIILNSSYWGRDSAVIGQADIYSALLDVAGLYGSYHWRGMGISPFAPIHPGFAIGSFGECRNSETDSTMVQHLRQARSISDKILRHNIDILTPL